MKEKPKVVIIGANFAGLAAAKRLVDLAEVTLIDPSPYFEFIPNIHELISGQKSPEDLRLERGELIQKMGHSWIQDRVTSLDPANQQLELSGGEQVEYDACIVTIGGVNNYYEVAGAEEFAFPFKSVEDCHRIGERFRTLKEAGKPFSVVVVGGGSEGVEALGEMLRSRKKETLFHIHLVEAQDRLLPMLSPKTSEEILRLCQSLPVDFHFGLRIETVQENSVVLSDGSTLPADLTIWTGGVQPNPLLWESGLSVEEGQWAAVKPSLQSRVFETVFVAGDAAGLNALDSKQAYFAMETGELAAENALKFLQGKSLQDFYAFKRPYLYSFGDLSCFFILDQIVLAGKPLSILKEGIFQKTMLEMQNSDTCQFIGEMYDRLLPEVLSQTADIFKSFFKSPLDFFCDPAIRLL